MSWTMRGVGAVSMGSALFSDPPSHPDTLIGSSSMRLDVDEWERGNETQTAFLGNGTVDIQG